jgi:hypothetical protein
MSKKKQAAPTSSPTPAFLMQFTPMRGNVGWVERGKIHHGHADRAAARLAALYSSCEPLNDSAFPLASTLAFKSKIANCELSTVLQLYDNIFNMFD